jgi:hypothetical protein
VRIDGQPGSATVIRVASTGKGRSSAPTLTEDWSDVSWTGDLLDQGKAALAKAVACLDSQSTGD